MDDRAPSPPPPPSPSPSPPPHSDKLKPLFTHEPLEPLSRRGALKDDTRHSPGDVSPNPSETPRPARPVSRRSRRSRPSSLSGSGSGSGSAPALVQPAVEGSTTQNRPSNSWLRYRRLKQVELAHLGLKMGELSKVIAKMWKEEPQEIKDFHKAQCQEQWASDRANGYQYRQPKMPLPGEPRAKKGRSGPWRKTQRPLLDAGSAPTEAGGVGVLNPLWAPPQASVGVSVGDVGDEQIAGPETSSATRASLYDDPHADANANANADANANANANANAGGSGRSRSPNAGPSRPPDAPLAALHRNRGLHPSTPSSNRRANNLSSSTSSSLFRPDDGSPPRALLAAEHKPEPTEFEFSPPRSEYDMDIDAGAPLAPIITSGAQSPPLDTANPPAPAAAATQGFSLPSLKQDPILGRALELPPVHDYFTHSPPLHPHHVTLHHHHRPSDSGTSPPSNRPSFASRPSSVLPRLRTALFTPPASPPPHTPWDDPWDDERPILQHLVTQPAVFPPHLRSHTHIAGPSSAHPDTRPPALPTSTRHQRVMSYPGAFEASSSGGGALRTPPKIAAATLTARPYPTRAQSPPAPRRRLASPLSDLRPIPPLHSTSPSHSRPQSQPSSEDELHTLALRLRSEGASRPDIQSMLRTVSPVPGLSKPSHPIMQDQYPSTRGPRSPRASWSSQHRYSHGSQLYTPLHPPSTQSDHDRAGNGVERVKRSRKVAQGAGDKEMRFLHTFSRDVWNTVDEGSAGVSLPLPVVDWPNAPEPPSGTSAFIRSREVTFASTSPMRYPGGMGGHLFDNAPRDPSCYPLHAKESVSRSKRAPMRGQEPAEDDELEESDVGQDVWAGRTVARGQLPISDSHEVHKVEGSSPSSRARACTQSRDPHNLDELKIVSQPLHPTKAEEGLRPEMPIHGSRKYGRMQDHTFRVAPLRPIELPSYCDPPTSTSRAPSGSEAHIMGSSPLENNPSSPPTNQLSGSTEPLTEASTGTSPTGEQMYWMFDTSGKTFVGYDGRIPHRTRGQRGRPRGRPRGSGRGSRVADAPRMGGGDPDVAMRMPNEYIMTGTISTPDLNEERDTGLGDSSNISDEQKA